jgi:hypothetical protein
VEGASLETAHEMLASSRMAEKVGAAAAAGAAGDGETPSDPSPDAEQPAGGA